MVIIVLNSQKVKAYPIFQRKTTRINLFQEISTYVLLERFPYPVNMKQTSCSMKQAVTSCYRTGWLGAMQSLCVRRRVATWCTSTARPSSITLRPSCHTTALIILFGLVYTTGEQRDSLSGQQVRCVWRKPFVHIMLSNGNYGIRFGISTSQSLFK